MFPVYPLHVFNIFETGATFTSVIAGEMGEVSRGSLHFQALFAVRTNSSVGCDHSKCSGRSN